MLLLYSCQQQNMLLQCHICKLVYVQIQANYVSIYTSHKLTTINNVTRNTGKHYASHYRHILLNKYGCHTANVFPLFVSCRLQRDVYPWYCAYQERNSKMQPLFTMLLPYMCQQQICPSNAIYILNCQNYSMYINLGNLLIYIKHMNSLA